MTVAQLPEHKAFRKHRKHPMAGQIEHIEHFRGMEEDGTVSHFAIAVLKDGRAYVGVAWQSLKDQYSRKKGFQIAVGRALALVNGGGEHPDFSVEMPLPKGGKEMHELLMIKMAGVINREEVA